MAKQVLLGKTINVKGTKAARTFRAETAQVNKSSSFWKHRLHTFGHTGWGDPIIYAYDQLERLELVKAAVMKHRPTPGYALDFGCGTGDFSKLLLSIGFAVCGYDPYVKPRIHDGNFTYSSTAEDISISRHAADLALSVTTLDHILTENEVIRALETIRSRMRGSGVFLALEYALDSAADRNNFALHNEYQAFRTLTEWTGLLSRSSFQIEEITPCPHPELRPSKGYIAYRRSSLVRIRRRYSQSRLLQLLCDPILQWNAAKFVERTVHFHDSYGPAPLKLIRCSPI